MKEVDLENQVYQGDNTEDVNNINDMDNINIINTNRDNLGYRDDDDDDDDDDAMTILKPRSRRR